MATYIDTTHFVAMLKTKRGGKGLREVADEIGDISASTLSRIENGKTPDLDVFLRICDWMEISAEAFLRQTDDVEEAPPNTLEIIETHLRADKNLDEATAKAIAEMVKAAYRLNRRDRATD